MKQKDNSELKNTIFLTLMVAIIFSIVVYLLIHFFTYLFLLKSDDYITSGIGAFMGAFSAFIFLIIEKNFSRYQKRRKRHFDGLVKTEYLLNENLQIVSDNVYLTKGLLKVVKHGQVHIGSFRQILWDRKILLDLANIELINKLASYGIDVKKANRDLNMMTELYRELRLALLRKVINVNTFKTNLPRLISQIESIIEILKKLDLDTEVRLSEVKVALRNRNAIDWFFNKISRHKLPKNFKEKVEVELIRLKKERDKTRKQSIKELAKIKQKVIK